LVFEFGDIHPRAATGQCACGFGVKVLRGRGLASEAKNLCDTVVANFLFVC
jgi:hypothetical protein